MMARRQTGWPFPHSAISTMRMARRRRCAALPRSPSLIERPVPRHVAIGREIERVEAECPRRVRRMRSISAAPRPWRCQRSSTDNWSSQAVPRLELQSGRSRSGGRAARLRPRAGRGARPNSSEAMDGRRHVDDAREPDARIASVGFVFDLRQQLDFVRTWAANHGAGLGTLRSRPGGRAMTIDIEPLKKQLGRKIEDEDVVTQAPLKAMIATFDRPDKVPAQGEAIAPGWHLCFLHSYARPRVAGPGRRRLRGRRAAQDPDAAPHVCRLDLHLRRRHPGRRQAQARDRVHRHPAARAAAPAR